MSDLRWCHLTNRLRIAQIEMCEVLQPQCSRSLAKIKMADSEDVPAHQQTMYIMTLPLDDSFVKKAAQKGKKGFSVSTIV